MRLIYIVLLVLVAVFALAACAPAEPTAYSLAPADQLPEFAARADQRVQVAYRFAMAHPEALETVPCYCGCQDIGHTSNRACYIKDINVAGEIEFDAHAVACGICLDITHDVMALMEQGLSPLQIRQTIDQNYRRFGQPTDTRMPEA